MDQTFKTRYFKQNAINKAQAYGLDLQYNSRFKKIKNRIIVAFFMIFEMFRFYILHKLCMPQIELVLTTKCTLRCKNCFNLMPYFSKDNHFSAELEQIKKNINTLLLSVDEIVVFYILGGEPLLAKYLPKLVDFLSQKKQIKKIEIVTNATILPSEELLEVLNCFRHKVDMAISDYSSNQEISRKIKISEVVDLLNKYNISYQVRGSNSGGNYQWIEYEKIYPRKRKKEDIIKNFISCKMPCVSMLDNTIHVCPVSSSYYQLNRHSVYKESGGGGYENDFIYISDKPSPPELRKRIIDFYNQNYFKCCDLCQDMSKTPKYTPPAIQTTEVITIP